MSASSLPDSSMSDLMEQYSVAAYEHRAASRIGDHETANAKYHLLATVVGEVRERGPEAVAALVGLLDHDLVEVRGWAAAHALEFDSERAERILELIAAGDPTLEQFSAEMVLREWRSGRLIFP